MIDIQNEKLVFNKKQTDEVVKIIRKFDERRADKIEDCASSLIFKVNLDNLNQRKLVKANFCKDKFCLECTQRKSRLMYHNLEKVLTRASEKNQEYLHIVLALRNCKLDELSNSISNLLEGFKRMMKRKKFKEAFKGYYRNLEITYNSKDDTLHPHLHIVVSVNKNYFYKNSNLYITQEVLKNEFMTACNVDYLPTAYINKVYSKNDNGVKGMIAEASKYITKVSDILNIDDLDKKTELMETMSKALFKRRLNGYGGILKEIFAELKLQNEEEADLLNLDLEDEEMTGSNFVYALFVYDKIKKEYILKRILNEYRESWEYWRERKKERREIEKLRSIRDREEFRSKMAFSV